MITRYINTASTVGGDGTTNATTGANRAYATFGDFEAAIRGAAFSDNLTVECCGATPDTTPKCDLLGDRSYFDAADRTMTIRANRSDVAGFHGGKWNTGTYRMIPSGSGGYGFTFGSSNASRFKLILDGIQYYSGSAVRAMVWYNFASNQSTMKNCLIYGAGGLNYNLVNIGPSNSTSNLIYNNVFLLTPSAGGHANSRCFFSFQNQTIYFCNNIVCGGWKGFHMPTGTAHIRNCPVWNNDDDFDIGAGDIDHCASDDGDGTNPIVGLVWANQFVDAAYEANVNYNLKAGSGLLDAGVGPGLDAQVPTVDIIADVRAGNIASVGPFENLPPVVPIADFVGTPLTGTVPLSVSYTDLSLNSPTSWDWDWGDLTAHGIAQNPTHIYTIPGVYTVTLTATNGAGSDSEIKIGYITVTSSLARLRGAAYSPGTWKPPRFGMSRSGRPIGIKIGAV